MELRGRNLLTLLDYSKEEILYLLDLADEYKKQKKEGVSHRIHSGKNIALIFEKSSTRTRCAFEVAAYDLGMNCTYLEPATSQIGAKESVADTARVLGRIYDGIEYRGYDQSIVEELATHAGVPVWNGLTNQYHPTQLLADMLTIRERLGRIKDIRVVYLGDARYNMGNSWMVACAKMGMNLTIATSNEYRPNEELIKICKAMALDSGGSIVFDDNIDTACKDKDIVYTDVWVSMGEPSKVWESRINALSPYRVTSEVMELAGPNALFMHCLPAFHDCNTTIGKDIRDRFGITHMEVTDEVFESKASIVFDEAENRMHTIKAIMAATL